MKSCAALYHHGHHHVIPHAVIVSGGGSGGGGDEWSTINRTMKTGGRESLFASRKWEKEIHCFCHGDHHHHDNHSHRLHCRHDFGKGDGYGGGDDCFCDDTQFDMICAEMRVAAKRAGFSAAGMTPQKAEKKVVKKDKGVQCEETKQVEDEVGRKTPDSLSGRIKVNGRVEVNKRGGVDIIDDFEDFRHYDLTVTGEIDRNRRGKLDVGTGEPSRIGGFGAAIRGGVTCRDRSRGSTPMLCCGVNEQRQDNSSRYNRLHRRFHEWNKQQHRPPLERIPKFREAFPQPRSFSSGGPSSLSPRALKKHHVSVRRVYDHAHRWPLHDDEESEAHLKSFVVGGGLRARLEYDGRGGNFEEQSGKGGTIHPRGNRALSLRRDSAMLKMNQSGWKGDLEMSWSGGYRRRGRRPITEYGGSAAGGEQEKFTSTTGEYAFKPCRAGGGGSQSRLDRPRQHQDLRPYDPEDVDRTVCTPEYPQQYHTAMASSTVPKEGVGHLEKRAEVDRQPYWVPPSERVASLSPGVDQCAKSDFDQSSPRSPEKDLSHLQRESHYPRQPNPPPFLWASSRGIQDMNQKDEVFNRSARDFDGLNAADDEQFGVRNQVDDFMAHHNASRPDPACLDQFNPNSVIDFGITSPPRETGMDNRERDFVQGNIQATQYHRSEHRGLNHEFDRSAGARHRTYRDDRDLQHLHFSPHDRTPHYDGGGRRFYENPMPNNAYPSAYPSPYPSAYPSAHPSSFFGNGYPGYYCFYGPLARFPGLHEGPWAGRGRARRSKGEEFEVGSVQDESETELTTTAPSELQSSIKGLSSPTSTSSAGIDALHRPLASGIAISSTSQALALPIPSRSMSTAGPSLSPSSRGSMLVPPLVRKLADSDFPSTTSIDTPSFPTFRSSPCSSSITLPSHLLGEQEAFVKMVDPTSQMHTVKSPGMLNTPESSTQMMGSLAHMQSVSFRSPSLASTTSASPSSRIMSQTEHSMQMMMDSPSPLQELPSRSPSMLSSMSASPSSRIMDQADHSMQMMMMGSTSRMQELPFRSPSMVSSMSASSSSRVMDDRELPIQMTGSTSPMQKISSRSPSMQSSMSASSSSRVMDEKELPIQMMDSTSPMQKISSRSPSMQSSMSASSSSAVMELSDSSMHAQLTPGSKKSSRSSSVSSSRSSSFSTSKSSTSAIEQLGSPAHKISAPSKSSSLSESSSSSVLQQRESPEQTSPPAVIEKISPVSSPTSSRSPSHSSTSSKPTGSPLKSISIKLPSPPSPTASSQISHSSLSSSALKDSMSQLQGPPGATLSLQSLEDASLVQSPKATSLTKTSVLLSQSNQSVRPSLEGQSTTPSPKNRSLLLSQAEESQSQTPDVTSLTQSSEATSADQSPEATSPKQSPEATSPKQSPTATSPKQSPQSRLPPEVPKRKSTPSPKEPVPLLPPKKDASPQQTLTETSPTRTAIDTSPQSLSPELSSPEPSKKKAPPLVSQTKTSSTPTQKKAAPPKLPSNATSPSPSSSSPLSHSQISSTTPAEVISGDVEKSSGSNDESDDDAEGAATRKADENAPINNQSSDGPELEPAMTSNKKTVPVPLKTKMKTKPVVPKPGVVL